MTDVSTEHPSGIPYIELVEQGRKISFRRDCLGEVKVFRKVDDTDWKLLVKHAKTPYVDSDDFPSGTILSYAIELEQKNKKYKYNLEVKL